MRFVRIVELRLQRLLDLLVKRDRGKEGSEERSGQGGSEGSEERMGVGGRNVLDESRL